MSAPVIGPVLGLGDIINIMQAGTPDAELVVRTTDGDTYIRMLTDCELPEWFVQVKKGVWYSFAELQARVTPEFKAWRTLVYEAHDYTCQVCHQRGSKKLHVDLRVSWADLDLTDASHGMTICHECREQRNA